MLRDRHCLMRLAKLKPLLEKFGVSRDGTAAIEFAILAIPYFLVVFAIIETFIAMIAQQFNFERRLPKELLQRSLGDNHVLRG